jgi:hypothetical protein
VLATIVGCEPALPALAATMCGRVGATPPPLPAASDGESLYAAADAIDIAVLAALGAA